MSTKKNKSLLITLPLLVLLAAGFVVNYFFFGEGLVSSFTPQGETPRESSITIEFSESILRGKTKDLINIPSTEPVLTFDPFISGEYTWLSDKKLQFVPHEKLQVDQAYVATLPKELYGVKLKSNETYKFHTPPFKLNHARMYFDFYIFDIGKKNILMDLSFNYDVDPEDIKRFVRLTRNKKDFPYEVVQSEDRTHYRLISGAIEKDHEKQEFKMSLTKELPNAESGTILKDDFEESISLAKIPNFKFEGHNSERKGQDHVLVLRFNKIVSPEFLSKYLSVVDISNKKEEPVPFIAKADTALIIITGKFKFNRTYKVTVKEELKAIDNSSLKKPIETKFSFPKPKKHISFLQNGMFLPVKDDINLFIQSYDVPKFSLQAYRVPYRNVPFLAGNLKRFGYGKFVYKKEFEVNTKDEFSENVTEVDVKSFIKKYGKGFYRFEVQSKTGGWPRAHKWILGTDLGLVVKQDQNNLMVFCASLTNFKPVSGVVVYLVSREGEALVTAKTNSKGFAILENYSKNRYSRPYMIVAEKGDDYAYMAFKDSKVNLTKFNVEGDLYEKGAIESFVYPSRDLFKPGEQIQLAAVVKKVGGGEIKDLPVRLQVFDPQSIPVFEENAALNEVGMTHFTFDLPSRGKTGMFVANLYLGKNHIIGKTTFRVEEFIPQSLKVDIQLENDSIKPGEPIKFKVKGRNLFGNAAAGRRALAKVEYTYKPFRPIGYKEFQFENNRFSFQSQKENLNETTLDETGMIQYETPVPGKSIPHGLLNCRIYAEVQQKGGRAVGRVKNIEIADKKYFIGVRKIQKAFPSLKTPTKFEIVALDRKGKPVTVKDVEIFIVKHGWYNIYQKAKWKDGGNYDSKEFQDIVLRKLIPALKGKTLFSFKHDTLGSYELIAIQKKDNVSANLGYYVAGKGYADVDLEEADQLKLQWGKADYEVGEEAELSINAPMKGLLLLTIERDEVLYKKFIEMKETAQVVKIPIRKEYLPNSYAVAMLFKSYDDADPTLPPKAYGAIPLTINKDERRLKLDIAVPEKINPSSTIDVVIKSNKSNKKTYVTLSVVEEGALDITGFRVPKIYDYFMRKRGLAVMSFDSFSQVMGNIPNLHGELTIGGGAYEASDKHLNPINFKKRKTVAYWSGPVKMKNGRAKIKVPVGSYNGSLRFMAVASSDDMYGSQEISREIYSPIIIQPTVPLSLGPTDKLNVPVSIFNKTGKTQTFSLKATTEGPLKIKGSATKTFELENEKEEFFDFRIETLNKLGAAAVSFTASAGDTVYSKKENLAVRPSSVKKTVIKQGILRGRKTARINASDHVYKQTQAGQFFVSPNPEAEHIGQLDALIRYPYGCLEQKVSIAFPQMYVHEMVMAVAPFVYRQKKEAAYIKDAIRTAEMNYRPRGYQLWAGNESIPYLGVYTTHFLTEAHKKDYQIKEKVYKGSLNQLKTMINSKLRNSISDQDLLDVTYALYVLANANRGQRESMEFIRNKVLDDESSLLSWLYLAAAYAKIGDPETAKMVLEEKKEILFPDEFTWWGNPYLSDLVATAILVNTLLEVDPTHPSLKIYLDSLTQKIRQVQNLNTHESSWILQAYAKLFKDNKTRTLNAELRFGEEVEALTESQYVKKTNQIDPTVFTLENKSKEPIFYSYYSEAYPVRSEYDNAEKNGIEIKSHLYNHEGNDLDLKTIQQSDLVIQKIELKVDAPGNVVLVLPFSGGLEIENPRLKKAEGLDWIPNYSNNSNDYIDIRDDRLLILMDLKGQNESRTFYFSFRAIFPGEFIVPYIFAENMYKLDQNGRTPSQKIFILPRE